VVGVPDPELSQRVAGFVQLASSAQGVNLNEIRAHVAEQLADYKVPESLKIVREIPRNALGKIDHQLLLFSVHQQICRKNRRRNGASTGTGLATAKRFLREGMDLGFTRLYPEVRGMA
jgi:acyl-coenzyme A synthetase/AMP-(fatty) acid ligase